MGGEIRPVNNMAARIRELSGIGFHNIIVPIPKKNGGWGKGKQNARLIELGNIRGIMEVLF